MVMVSVPSKGEAATIQNRVLFLGSSNDEKGRIGLPTTWPWVRRWKLPSSSSMHGLHSTHPRPAMQYAPAKKKEKGPSQHCAATPRPDAAPASDRSTFIYSGGGMGTHPPPPCMFH